jgi:hypothetical protein
LKRVSPQLRSLAKRLMASETSRTTSAEVEHPATFRAIDKLRPQFSILMGRSGFQALLARALVLAAAEAPWLTEARVVADGELEGLTAAHATRGPAEFAEGELVLLAQILRLLVAFIGPTLTLRLINQLWPQLSFSAADFSNAASHEEAK